VFLIALTATVLAFIQNIVMFGFGLKELAIFAFPLSFTGICLIEIISIWLGYFFVRKFLHARRTLALAGWVITVLIAAELALPVSSFSMLTQQVQRKRRLDQIELIGTSVEALASDRNGVRFALTYTLKFPKTAHYLTFPAYLGPQGNRVFGHYFTKVHPEYYEESYVFDAANPYTFTVVFDTEGRQFDFSRERANIDICDRKDYFMACRIISIGVEGVPGVLAAHPSPVLHEPAVEEDNVRDLAEKSIRLDRLQLDSEAAKMGAPIRFSFVITNIGKKDVVIPEGKPANIISINYGWEAVSESAKTTKVIPGTMHPGNWVTAGGAELTFVRKSALTPGETVPFQDKITPFEPLKPGEYKLHVFLFSRYSTEENSPVQELVQKFSVVP